MTIASPMSVLARVTGIVAVAVTMNPLKKFLYSLMVAMRTGLGWLDLGGRNFDEENTRLPNFIADTFSVHPDAHGQYGTRWNDFNLSWIRFFLSHISARLLPMHDLR